jgi:rubrerythrin
MLSGEGFNEVYNLSGGIMAWDGGVAEGPVALNLDMISGDETPAEIIRLAYGMEQSLGQFYRKVRIGTDDKDLADLLELLASIEDKHKEYLLNLYNETEPAKVSQEDFEAQVPSTAMEGGFEIEEFIDKNKRFLSTVPSLLDVSMMLETQALDLYIRFSRKTENDRTKELLLRIADEEKSHLTSLGRLRQERA